MDSYPRKPDYTAFYLTIFSGCFILGVLMHKMPDPEVDQHYCDMVRIFQQTEGEFGWPDYKGVYDEECSNG